MNTSPIAAARAPERTPHAPAEAPIRLDGARITLVTTGHPATNPRLVKEADAFAGAGARVRVVACKFLPWADRADAAFEGRPWYPPTWVRFGALASAPVWQAQRLRKKVSAALALRTGTPELLAVRGLHYMVPELARAAAAEPADLFVAHNLAALPAALRAARRYAAPTAFDAEDFHRGERPEAAWDTAEARLTRWAEERFIPRAAYVTAASDGIGQAYAEALGIPRPTTVLNVFPLAERDVPLAEAERAAEKPPGARTLYWFSQNLGPGRGLEAAIAALPLLPADVHLVLRGALSEAARDWLGAQVAAASVAGRVHVRPPVPPDELVARAALHDVGLALERPTTINSDLCVANKVFTYLLAGTPVLATDTTGQRGVCAAVPEATRVIPADQPEALAQAARELLERADARAAARAAGDRYNWDAEQRILLRLAARALGRSA